ncbi:MAG: CoA-binding protein [Chloroflexi bacterium]|nr:CoA-binding protein [Chloroflexota bacterium]
MAADITSELDHIFKPRSVAVIGASNTPGKWGYRMIHNPLRGGYRGALYPINPGDKMVAGLPAYPSVSDVPGEIDLAVFVIPAVMVLQTMEQCIQKGVKGVVLITAGFAETGEEGKALQDAVVKLARGGGMRLVGPNGNGVFSSTVGLNLPFDIPLKSGAIAFLSQSGTFGSYLAQVASAKGYGISKYVSMGNQADLNAADYLQYMAQDEDTKAIVLYMEGFKDGRRFFEVAREVIKTKPIIIYKAGRTPVGARAAISHTASMAGSDQVFEAMCKQLGILRAPEAAYAFDMAEALVSQPLPLGKRVAIMGSGGQSVVTSDFCAWLGLEVPILDEKTQDTIRELLPPQAPPPRNPVDFAGGPHNPLNHAQVAEIIAQADYIDGIIANIPGGWSGNGMTSDLARMVIDGIETLVSIPQQYGKVLILSGRRLMGTGLASELIREANIPVYDTPEEASRAMYALAYYAETRRRLRQG